MLAMIFMMLPRASVSAKRINEVLDTPISVKEGTVTENNSDIKGTVEFKNVSFKYPDADEYMFLKIYRLRLIKEKLLLLLVLLVVVNLL